MWASGFVDVDVDRLPRGGGGVLIWAGKLWTTNTIAFIWMHRYTVMRSWRPFSFHLSVTITSCLSMLMHSLMSQGSVHKSWKLNISQFFHSLHTHQTCHPLSLFWMLNALDRPCPTACFSFRQYPATSQSHWKGVGHSTGHNQQPDQLYVKEMFHAAGGK